MDQKFLSFLLFSEYLHLYLRKPTAAKSSSLICWSHTYTLCKISSWWWYRCKLAIFVYLMSRTFWVCVCTCAPCGIMHVFHIVAASSRICINDHPPQMGCKVCIKFWTKYYVIYPDKRILITADFFTNFSLYMQYLPKSSYFLLIIWYYLSLGKRNIDVRNDKAAICVTV